MSEEIADSEFNMEAAQQSISDDLFQSEEDVSEEISEEVHEEIAEETEEPEEVTEETTEVKAKNAPQSWKKEMHEAFSSLPPNVQEYIEQREQQMRDGLEKDRTDANLGRTMRDVITPHLALIKEQGINEVDAVRYMLNAHNKLSRAQGEEKSRLAQEFLQAYGITTDGKEVDPVISQLRQELNGIKTHLTASQERTLQEQRSRVMKDVESFASEHPYFDDVADDIVPFINAGLDLKDAYEKAVWANPVTRQKEIERTQKEAEEKAKLKAKQEAEAAKKAKSVNVRGRDTQKTPTGPKGTMEDTMRETFREIQSRS